MRVLVTGFMARSADRSHQLDYIDGHDALDGIIRDLGHTLERRSVLPGEDLRAFDRVIVYVAQIGSLGCTRMLGGLWTLGNRPDAIVAVDDWRCYLIRKQCKVRYIERKTKDLGSHYQGIDVFNTDSYVRDTILKTAEMFDETSGQPLPWSVMAPSLEGADRSQLKLDTVKTFYHFYYANWYREKYGVCPGHTPKKKQWILAALSKESHEWAKDLNLQWPIVHVGHKAYGAKMTEVELFKLYCDSYGVLSPEYNTAKSGWYRARFQLAYDARCVLAGGEDEMKTIYGSSYDPRYLETSVANGLFRDIVALQGTRLRWRSPSKEQLAATVEKMLREA